MTGVPDSIFREYDIRGTGKELTPDIAELLGRAYAIYVKKHGLNPGPDFKVSIGRDVRLTSDGLFEWLKKGLLSSGVNIIDIGTCPTPLQYFSMHTLPVKGGVMITGSHNPPEYNGFKVSVGKETIHGEEIQKLKDIINEEVIGKPLPKIEAGKVDRKSTRLNSITTQSRM